MAKGFEQRPVECGMSREALSGIAKFFESGHGGEPLSSKTGESLVRWAGGRFFLGRGHRVLRRLPAVDQCLDVSLENLGEVVVAVELVFVRDAGEGLDCLGDGHGEKVEG